MKRHVSTDNPGPPDSFHRGGSHLSVNTVAAAAAALLLFGNVLSVSGRGSRERKRISSWCSLAARDPEVAA
jgi:hypothetical protein